MTRRVIYLRNPSEGSNFRTINGSGGGGGTRPPKKTKTKAPKPPSSGWRPGPTPGTWVSPRGTIYKATPSNWLTFHDNPGMGYMDDVNSSGGQSTGLYDAFEFGTTLEYEGPNTLVGDLFFILNGVDPERGVALPPYGAPGTLRSPLMIEAANMMNQVGNYSMTPFFPGKLQMYATPTLQQRPAWLKWYEDTQGASWQMFGH
jgi:hypothetical protein